MKEVDTVNIPAFQRKRSLSAKARSLNKRKTYKTLKPKKKTIRSRKRKTEEETFTNIPIRQSLPSQELFPTTQPKIKKSEFREMKTCGIIEGYYDSIKVAVISVTSPIRTGDSLIFEQTNGLFEQEVSSMQINKKDVSLARSGSDIGIKVIIEPIVGTNVYKVI